MNRERTTQHAGRCAALTLLFAVLLGACGQAGTTTAPTAPAAAATAGPAATAAAPAAAAAPEATAAAPAATPAPAATAAPTAAAVGPDQFKNPVVKADFPDPHLIAVDGTWYAYATNGSGKNVQLATSTDLISWQLKTDAMPALAPWVRKSEPLVWAPEVIQIGEQFVLYYTARDQESNKQCVGAAVAASPEGKFRDTNERPFVCQVGEGGTIDASPFRDADGTLYLYFKNDGNCCGMSTKLYVQELAPDGLSLLGEPVALVQNDRRWEGRVVEAPTMWLHDGRHYLFFSGNDYAGLPYAVGYATCESARGPCTDAEENPILASETTIKPIVAGPGHQTIITDADGQTWLVYHAWEITSSGTRGNRRFVWLDRLVWNNGVPDVEGPTREPQARPAVEGGS